MTTEAMTENSTGTIDDSTLTTADGTENMDTTVAYMNWTATEDWSSMTTGLAEDEDKESSLKYALLASIVITLGLNCGLFLWKAIRSRRDPAHAVLVGNLVASHMFTGIYLLLPFLDSSLRESGITDRTPRRLCEIVSYLQMFSYEATVGSLLVIVMDRVYSFRHPLTVTGLTPTVSRMMCSIVWLASFIAAAIYVSLIAINPYDHNPYGSLSHVFFCWNDDRIVVEYFMAITVWLNLAFFSAIFALYVAAVVMKCKLSGEEMSETIQSAKERMFFIKTFIITVLSLGLWIVLPVAAFYGNDGDGYFNNKTSRMLYIVSVAGPAVFNPIIYLIGSINCSHDGSDSPLKQSHSFGSATTKRQISIRLSNYLQNGESLTPQDAVIMTSCLSTSVHTLHNLGMAASSIDPDHIMVEKNSKGALVDTHLIGVPMKPKKEILNSRVQEDKEAIGRIFDCVMAHIQETTTTSRLSPLDRKQTSIRLLKSLSVRNSRNASMLNATMALKRQDRPASWKV